METKRWNLKNEQLNHIEAIREAADLLKKGEVVAFPTETVYGLGADATNEEAVAKIFAAKGRPQDNPLIAHVANKAQLKQLVTNIPPYAEKIIDAFSPGPITYVLPSNGVCASNVTAGLSTVAVRIPDHPVAKQLLTICNLPIAAPSANISGKPSPTMADHVWDDLNGKIAGLIDGGQTGVGMESTVVDCTQAFPVILRPGGVTQEQLAEVIDMGPISYPQREKEGPKGVHKIEKPSAPGMKYKHYSPEVPLWIVEGGAEKLQTIINEALTDQKKVGVLASEKMAKALKADKTVSLGVSLNEIAINLYDGLRSFRYHDVDLIVCEAFPEEGIGVAIMNRLNKAASKHL